MPASRPLSPERDRLDLRRAGQRGEDDLALLGERLRAVGPDRAGGHVLLGGGPADVVDDELVAGLLQVGRHAGAHRAEPDETDFHVMSPKQAGRNRLPPKSPYRRRPESAVPTRRAATSGSRACGGTTTGSTWEGARPYFFSNTSLATSAAVIAAGQPA